MAQYKAARDYYLSSPRTSRWEPKIIQYRKTYCDNQIIDVEPASPAARRELPSWKPASRRRRRDGARRGKKRSRRPANPSNSITSRAAWLALENELAALDTDNLRLREELKSASKAKADLDALRADLDRKNERIQALEKELEAKHSSPRPSTTWRRAPTTARRKRAPQG